MAISAAAESQYDGVTNPSVSELAPVIDIGTDFQEIEENPQNFAAKTNQLVRRLGNVASAVIKSVNTTDSVEIKREIITINGFDHSILITEPGPGFVEDTNTATNEIILPGLAEMDRGSGLNWHKALAQQHQDRRIITVANDGISCNGQLVPFLQSYGRRFEDMAEDRLALLPYITKDGPINIVGTSMGTVLSMYMAEQNLAANNKDQINLEQLKLVSSAVIACSTEIDEDYFREPDIDEDAMCNELTKSFFLHVPGDTARMLCSNPLDLLACASIIGEYILKPHKAPNRALTIAGNLTNVQRGINWKILKSIASEYEMLVLGGEKDPLTKAQIKQWEALQELYPENVQHKILKGKGHCMTIDAKGVAKQLADMEI